MARGVKTGGRVAGVPNKATAELREAILIAAELAGGEGGLVGYLQTLATTNSGAVASLLGKVIPTQVIGNGPEGQIQQLLRITFQKSPDADQ